MIQRIQTIFLLSAISLISILFFYPFAEIAVGSDIFTFSIKGFVDNGTNKVIKDIISVPVFVSIIILINIATIVLFKKRKLQMRFSVYNIILMLGMSGILFYLAHSAFEPAPTVEYKITILFPVIAAIFNYMAFRNIRKDELLVRAVDRIR